MSASLDFKGLFFQRLFNKNFGIETEKVGSLKKICLAVAAIFLKENIGGSRYWRVLKQKNYAISLLAKNSKVWRDAHKQESFCEIKKKALQATLSLFGEEEFIQEGSFLYENSDLVICSEEKYRSFEHPPLNLITDKDFYY